MGYNEVLLKVKTKLESVSGIGQVYDYERHAKTWEKWLSLFKIGDILHTYTITRESCPEEAMVSRTNKRIHNMVIRMYYALDDVAESEKTAQNLVDLICAEFRSSPDFETDVIQAGPPSLRVFEPRMFGEVLCHYAEIVIPTEEEEQFSP